MATTLPGVAANRKIRKPADRIYTAAITSAPAPKLKKALGRDGTAGYADRLAAAAATAPSTTGLTPHPNQVYAAACLAQPVICEVATGEGKTLAIALSAAAWAN